MRNTYYRKLIYCAGLTLLSPSCAFHAIVSSNHVGRDSVRQSQSRTHDTLDRVHLETRLSRQSETKVGGTCTAPSRHRSLRKLAAISSEQEDSVGVFYTPSDLQTYSAPWGITLRYRSTLNTYRIEAFRENGELAGYTTGFYIGDYLHLDKVQVQRKESKYEPGAPNAPEPGTRELPWAAKTPNIFQLGAVLGCAAVRFGWEKGARRVELLAIRENERQHSRIVRYYRIAGFRPVREVGEDLRSLQDRLLWGAEGTLMAADVEEFMRRWAPMMMKSSVEESTVRA